MNEMENLYVIAMEECAEIQQCISKILRFGEQNYHPNSAGITNADELLKEYYQLQTVMEMIINKGILGTLSEDKIKEIKQSKYHNIIHYAKVSKNNGRIK